VPVVVTLAGETEADAPAEPIPAARAATVASRGPDDRIVAFERSAGYPAPGGRSGTPVARALMPTMRWILLRGVAERLLAAYLERLGLGGAALEEPVGDELGGGHVLDGKTNRLEGGDRLRITRRGPVAADGADLDEVPFRE
jgi:hypothetical protein